MDNAPTLLDKVMTAGEVRTAYQPIFSIEPRRATVFALESLSRGPSGTNIESADVLFEYVRRKRKEDIVDVTCVRSAIRIASVLPRFGKLFVNAHASSLAKDQYFVDNVERICDAFAFQPLNLVIEIVEHSPYWDRGEFLLSTRRLREMGIQIAVDDLGVAYSGYKVILDAVPQYLKVDMYITQGCHHDRTRRSMIESFLLLASQVGADLIAEGIEDASDLQVLQAMGVTLCQGYLLARPQTASTILRLLSLGGSIDEVLAPSIEL